VTQNSFDGQKSDLETSFESAIFVKQEENAKVFRKQAKNGKK